MKYKQMIGSSTIRYTLIFLQIIGLILGVTSFSLVCYAYGDDVNWNNIVKGTAEFPQVYNEKYFSGRRLEWQWIADEKTMVEIEDAILEEEELLRDSLFDPLFITGFAIVLTTSIFHLMWTFVYILGSKNLKLTVWLNLIECLCQLLLGLIVALTAGDNNNEMEIVRKDFEEETADLEIGNNGAQIKHGKDFAFFGRIFRVCLGHNSTGFEIPGYGFWYDKDALTELGFCPESDVKFSASICACFFGVLLGITALVAQIAVSSASKAASRAQVVPEQQQQGIKLKTLPTTVFGSTRTFTFGQFDLANLSERRECLSRQFSYHPFPRFSFQDIKDFPETTESLFTENSLTNISD